MYVTPPLKTGCFLHDSLMYRCIDIALIKYENCFIARAIHFFEILPIRGGPYSVFNIGFEQIEETLGIILVKEFFKKIN